MSIAYTKEGVRYCQTCFNYVNKSEAVGTRIRGQDKHYYRCKECMRKVMASMAGVILRREWIAQRMNAYE